MRTTFTLLFLITGLFSFAQDTIHNTKANDVYLYGEGADPVYHLSSTEKPFTGTIVEYDRMGRKQAVKNYLNGKQHGQWLEYRFFNGDLYLEKEYTFKQGKLDGDYTEYMVDKVSMQGQYQNGERIGTFTWYEYSGEIKKEINY